MERSLPNNVGNWKFPTCFYLYVNIRGFLFFPPGAKTKTQSLVLEPQMDVLREPLERGEKCLPLILPLKCLFLKALLIDFPEHLSNPVKMIGRK